MEGLSRKGAKLYNDIAQRLTLDRLAEMRDFYLTKQGVAFAIRDVHAYKIEGTDSILVLGDLEPAVKTAEAARKAREQEKQEALAEQLDELAHELAEEGGPSGEAQGDLMTEDDISVVMVQGKVSREDAINALKKNNCDPLEALVDLGK